MSSRLARRTEGLDGVRRYEQSLQKWDRGVPPLLRPLLRAYLLGYASAVAPRIVTLVLQHATARRPGLSSRPLQPRRAFLESLLRILRGGLDLQRFPTFCAVLVGGSTLLEVPAPGLHSCSPPSFPSKAR